MGEEVLIEEENYAVGDSTLRGAEAFTFQK